MKNNLDLNNMGLVEMNHTEMENVIGGSWFSDAWNWVCNNFTNIAAVVASAAALFGAYKSNR